MCFIVIMIISPWFTSSLVIYLFEKDLLALQIRLHLCLRPFSFIKTQAAQGHSG